MAVALLTHTGIILFKYCSDLSLFVMISNILQMLSLQPRISKSLFRGHENNFCSQQVRTTSEIKYHQGTPINDVGWVTNDNPQTRHLGKNSHITQVGRVKKDLKRLEVIYGGSLNTNIFLPLIIHSMARPSLLLQKTTLSPWTTLKESNLLHWTRNFVKRLWGPTISGSASLTRILRGPEKKKKRKWIYQSKKRKFMKLISR